MSVSISTVTVTVFQCYHQATVSLLVLISISELSAAICFSYVTYETPDGNFVETDVYGALIVVPLYTQGHP